jgi:hypothetical protein
MNVAHIPDWVAAQPLTASDIDCATAVMLKILDGKCKMNSLEKFVMVAFYDAVKERPGLRFERDLHDLIASTRAGAGDALRMTIYERRLLAETAISRPVMKSFKAMIRAQGLFDGFVEAADTEEMMQ